MSPRPWISLDGVSLPNSVEELYMKQNGGYSQATFSLTMEVVTHAVQWLILPCDTKTNHDMTENLLQ